MLQYVNINDSKVKFVNESENPISQIQDENADLIFQNAMQDMELGQLKDENADLLFRVAMLEVSK